MQPENLSLIFSKGETLKRVIECKNEELNEAHDLMWAQM